MMIVIGIEMFDTAIGPCGVAWSEYGVVGVQLPEADAAATQALLGRRFPGAARGPPPARVVHAIAAITALLRGEADDMPGVVLDLRGVAPFERSVFEACRRIAAGSTLTYGELALEIGAPGAARAVGQALGRNPYAPVVPCHRVLAAGGRPGGFSAHGGLATKLRLLDRRCARLRSGQLVRPCRAGGGVTRAVGRRDACLGKHIELLAIRRGRAHLRARA